MAHGQQMPGKNYTVNLQDCKLISENSENFCIKPIFVTPYPQKSILHY